MKPKYQWYTPQSRTKGQIPSTNYRFLSHNLISALRAKLCPGLKLCSTLAAFILRPQCFSALGTELCPLRMRPARRTQRHCLRCQVHTLGQVRLEEHTS